MARVKGPMIHQACAQAVTSAAFISKRYYMRASGRRYFMSRHLLHAMLGEFGLPSLLSRYDML